MLEFDGDHEVAEKVPCPVNRYDLRRTSPVSRRRRGGGGEEGGEEGGETAIGGEGEVRIRKKRAIKARFEHSSAGFFKFSFSLFFFFNLLLESF